MKTEKRIIKPVKTCYEHIGGKLGAMFLEMCIRQEWIQKANPAAKHFFITEKGQKEFSALGLDLSQINSEV